MTTMRFFVSTRGLREIATNFVSGSMPCSTL
jgi:hypothetical protein